MARQSAPGAGRLALVGASMTVLLILVVLGSRSPAADTATSATVPWVTDLLRGLASSIPVLAGAAVLTMILTVSWPQRSAARRGERQRTSLLGYLLFAGLLTLARAHVPPARASAAGAAPRIIPVAAAHAHFPPVDTTAVMVAVAVAAVAGGAILALRALQARRAGVAAILARSLSTAVDDSLLDFKDGDPRHAVIATYARMERALGSHGLPRRRAEAPLEYTARLLSELTASPDPVNRLTRLFEWARFSHHVVDPAMQADAISALEAIRASLSQRT